ncbi:hypothetical protein E4U42_006135 [Claviceps africana]|uniref:3-hydroxyisobutyryl-CoA hydrolase n=1 Tax=Claviceps africana TaxID=83212 RepID=A0A8K0J3P3_9HYPO|nr:hypothetical protein E4U42_006135 [Claviceps africana]
MSFRAFAARAVHVANWSSRSRSNLPMAQSIKVPSLLSVRPLSTEATNIRELPGDEKDDVVFGSRYGLRTVMLNRPEKLNSLNASMIRKIVPRLIEWEKSDMANIVVMKGTGEKALCAGGDVVALAQYNQESREGWKKSVDYFGLEYKLDHYIATYRKPYIAFMDGITMGGGVGLSIHAPFRIATEKTVFAMPETSIGFFPDVGASFFLPRMNGAVGTYLALTSQRLTGPSVFYSGVATHYIHSTSLPDLECRLAELRFRDDDSLPDRLAIINDTLEEFCTGLPYDQPMQLSGAVRQAIDRCFGKNNMKDVVAALKEEGDETKKWARETLSTLRRRSPTALHVTLRQMHVGGKWDIAEAFNKEYQIASKFMQHKDFTEGVIALLVDKREPRWRFGMVDAVPASENIAKPFLDFEKGQALQLFTDRTYSEYPFQKLGVPTEKEIKAVVKGNSYTPQEAVRTIVASRNGRQGIADVVNEVMSRKTAIDDQGKVKWVDNYSPASSRL